MCASYGEAGHHVGHITCMISFTPSLPDFFSVARTVETKRTLGRSSKPLNRGNVVERKVSIACRTGKGEQRK